MLSLCQDNTNQISDGDSSDTDITEDKSDFEEVMESKNSGPLKNPILPPIYLCGACQNDCLNDPSSKEEESIECTGCHLWFHLKCVKLTGDCSEEDIWLCSECIKTVVAL